VPQTSLSLAEARRIALDAQGFGQARPSRPTIRHARGVIDRLGLVQLDFVNVLVPAHYFVLYSRLGPYDRSLLDRLIYSRGSYTEHWAHEASILPVSTWPLLRHRMEAYRVRPYDLDPWVRSNQVYADAVLEAVRERGPLLPDAIEPPEDAPGLDHTWFRSLPKLVLESHLGWGSIAVVKRNSNFARVYDLAERVIPAMHLEPRLSREEQQRHLILLAARSYGIATAADLADFYRMSPRDARPRIAELVHAGSLAETRVEGWKDPAYLDPAARLPRTVSAASLLSPFDPVVWFRPRAARLFGFDYRIEIYTPAHQRKFGYYVLPFLLGDRLVARVDLKAERVAGRLTVLSAHLEACADADEVAPALAGELRSVGRWLGLDEVRVEGRGGLAAALRRQSLR
jgi:uncharacterized protein YcaQ